MAENRVATQLSVFLVNKPGVLAQVTRALAEEKINIVAMTLVDSQEHGVLRFVAEDLEAARGVVRRLNLPATETEVLVLELSNRPGALADVAGLLGQNHININYAYCTGGSNGNGARAILKVSDLPRALRTLEVRKPKRKEMPVRRPAMRR